MATNLKTSFFVLITILCFTGCSSEKDTYSQLEGTWLLNKAIQEGKKIERLQDLIFKFKTKDSIHINLFSEKASFDPYTIEGETIKHYHPNQTYEYQIQIINDTSLILNAQFTENGSPHVLHFRKSK